MTAQLNDVVPHFIDGKTTVGQGHRRGDVFDPVTAAVTRQIARVGHDKACSDT